MKKINIFIWSLLFLLFFFWQIIFAATFTTPFSTAANYTMDNEIEVSGGLAKIKQSSLWNGLQGYWKMDDAAGQIIDSSGNNNNGTDIVGGIGYGYSGKINNSVNFKEGGVNGKVNITEQSSLALAGAFSYGAWFKADSFSNWAGIMSRMSSWGHGYNLQVGTTQRIACGDGLYTNSDFMPMTGQWYHAVCVYDGTKMQLYVNGVKQTDEDIRAMGVGSNNLQLGVFYTRAGTSISLPFDGVIDEAFVYNRALTPTEITELYNTGNGKEITQYNDGTYSITKTSGDSNSVISNFTSFSVTEGVNNGSLHYQLSEDGTNWKYWNGTSWINAGVTDYNTEADINTNISTFPTTANKIYVKSFLTSNGSQRVEIDQIEINYDTNSSPTDIQIDGGNTDNVNEGTASGTNIAILTTTDTDAGDTHIYTLVAGTGDEDNAKFTITGNQLKLNFTPDFENPTDLGDTVGNNTYSVRIQTNDGHGGTYQKSFIISIIDLDENIPVISLLGSPVVNLNIGDVYLDAGATATDDVDGDITANIVVVNPVDTNIIGDYIVTYNVDDSAGNSAVEVIRRVIVSSGQTGRSRPKSFKKKKVCKDPKALNYEVKGRHTVSLCEYKKTEERNSDNVKKELQKQIDHLLKLLKDQQETPSGESCEFFKKELKKGDRGEEVKKIQKFLRKEGYFTYQKNTGYFGVITEQAVKYFQVRYSDEILKPLDLVLPTGKWFEYTKKQANSMLGCDL